MTAVIDEIRVHSWALSALINDDRSGLSDDEARAVDRLEQYCSDELVPSLAAETGEPVVTWHFSFDDEVDAFGLPTFLPDTADWSAAEYNLRGEIAVLHVVAMFA